jgi:hypothetical protein
MTNWRGYFYYRTAGAVQWYATVVDVNVEPVTNDKFGQIKSGKLVMRGLLGLPEPFGATITHYHMPLNTVVRRLIWTPPPTALTLPATPYFSTTFHHRNHLK